MCVLVGGGHVVSREAEGFCLAREGGRDRDERLIKAAEAASPLQDDQGQLLFRLPLSHSHPLEGKTRVRWQEALQSFFFMLKFYLPSINLPHFCLSSLLSCPFPPHFPSESL